MATDIRKLLVPGAKVRITQQIAARHYSLGTTVEGTVLSYEQKTTGSWYAHSRDDKLWLDRIKIKKNDGEISVLNLDDYTDVTIIDPDPTSTR